MRTPFGETFAADPHTPLAWYRAHCPVARVATPAGHPIWMVTRDADVRAGLLNPRLSLGPTAPRPSRRRALDITLVGYEGRHHAAIRRLAAPLFTPHRLRPYRPVIEAIADDLLTAVARCPRADLMSAFAHPFSFGVMCELFALPRAARPDLHAWAASTFARPARDARAASANLDRLDAFFREEVGRRLARPGDDVMSAIVTGWDPGGEVTREEVVSLCATLLLAGYESTAQMIGMCVAELLARDALRGLRPASARRTVEELLRYTTPGPFATPRTATADVEIDGTPIPAGSRVLLSVAAANRDPARHRDPDLLDPDRPPGHLTFGLGPHFCLGAPLARMELEVALTAVAARWPALAPATPLPLLPWRGNHLNRGLAEFPVHPAPDG